MKIYLIRVPEREIRQRGSKGNTRSKNKNRELVRVMISQIGKIQQIPAKINKNKFITTNVIMKL